MSDHDPLAVPTIHRNGTSAEALIAAYCDAGNAITAAIKSLADTAPNARDFYLQDYGALPRAQRQHDARMGKLQEVLAELQALAEAIDGQGSQS